MMLAGLLGSCMPAARAAKITTKLAPDAVKAFELYVAETEPLLGDRFDESKIGWTAGAIRDSAMAILGKGRAVAFDRNPAGTYKDLAVRNGVIHHWAGAIAVANRSVAQVAAVLQDYSNYKHIYKPEVVSAEAKLLSSSESALKYKVHLLLLRIEKGIPFAFHIDSIADYAYSPRPISASRLDVTSRSTLVRETDSGKPDYRDLLPEGEDHGIIWKINTYWRLRQEGPDVYAECEMISLSRATPALLNVLLLGRVGDMIRAGAVTHLKGTLENTKAAAGKT